VGGWGREGGGGGLGGRVGAGVGGWGWGLGREGGVGVEALFPCPVHL